ncbi:MAG TPA: hypothetical protein VES73_13210 [Lamprocystis sp. (in: g-proteobacteria)]|nr:hypothetical protein [Lamprocystis sp. (in: g-proteobacteria)]
MTQRRAGPVDRGEVHLGDLVRALHALRPRDLDQAAAIARCLGFGLRDPASAAPSANPHRVFDRADDAPRPPVPESQPPPSPPVFTPPRPRRPVPVPAGTLPTRLTALPTRAPPATPTPGWLGPAAARFPAAPEPRRSRRTLLPEGTARHVLAAALATRRPGGVLDLPRLVDALGRREPLRALPRCPEYRLALGCHLLLDYSGAMVPFWEDLSDLSAQVCAVAGTAVTRVHNFDTDPSAARYWTTSGKPWPLVPDGRPVLAATDLGLTGHPRAEPHRGWAGLAAACARTGSPLLLLIPWPRGRWPRGLPAQATLIHWGPRTTAGMVHRQAAVPSGARS